MTYTGIYIYLAFLILSTLFPITEFYFTMAAVLRNVELGLKETGSPVTVPNHPQARLMFYLDCMCSVLSMDNSSPSLNALRDFRNYTRLSYSQVDELLVLCILLSPDVLLNKCIFLNEEMCRNSCNKFFELSAVSNQMLVTDSVLIGGQQRRVQKIMTFKEAFLRMDYIEPMDYYSQRLRRIASSARLEAERRPQRRAINSSPDPSNSGRASCCIVL